MITLSNVSKTFGNYKAIENLNVNFSKSCITAIVGPNGSGKTTLIKSILGLVKIDQGSIIINGLTLNGESSYRQEIGYMPQLASYPENLTGNEMIDLLIKIRNLKDNIDDELINSLGMKQELNKPIRTLSGGTKQKLSAVLAFLFKPKIIILDEPTAALDPLASSIVKDKIISENSLGKTVILTSHNMHDIEELAEEILFLIEGKVVFFGSKSDLKSLSNEENLERAVAFLMKR
ncbi:MAG: ABC transporter ATP-binding protein [Ignavibacteria bacterium]|nr:ABC transporter ATP-binding protein [Ignavibacteria bacterium]